MPKTLGLDTVITVGVKADHTTIIRAPMNGLPCRARVCNDGKLQLQVPTNGASYSVSLGQRL